MVFFNRRMGNRLRPINSTKHIVDLQGGIPGNAAERRIIVKSVENPLLANVTDVSPGSKVFSLFLNIQVISTAETSLNNTYWYIFKNPGGNIPTSEQVPANAVGTADFKRQVFHQEMAMLSDPADSIPMTMFKGVLRIPKVFNTMRIGDEIGINFFSPGASNTQNYCVQSIFKEYR